VFSSDSSVKISTGGHCKIQLEMGYGGKYTRVKEAVRELLRVKQEVFMPLVHRVGEAQVDFGYGLATVSTVSKLRSSPKLLPR